MRAHSPRIAVVLAIAITGTAAAGAVRAAQNDKAAPAPMGALWAMNHDTQALTLVVAGQDAPQTFTITPDTQFSGMCRDCALPLTFKSSETGKNCKVCGCNVSNAQCIVGKPVKPGTWDAMLQGLPFGVAMRPTYNTPDKPESGLKCLLVDIRSAMVPVDGLSGQTPEQLTALVKPIGGQKPELLDGGKRLSMKILGVWTADKEAKLEKALAAVNAKVVHAPEKTETK